jgi:hypothetical protein
MAFSRQLGVIGILGACFCVAVGCDDDGDKIANGGDAGEAGDDGGGKAGTAGKSTGGSSNNNAGDGGMGGTATTGGTSGAGAAGETMGGAAPVGGGAGEGGTVGDGGSVVGGGAGVAGDAGSAGDGGGGGTAPTARTCSYTCEDDDDCAFVDGPPTYSCDPEKKECVQCTTDAACLPGQSAWVTECADDTGCPPTDACVAWQGKGYCAYKADPQNPVDSCFGFGAPKTVLRQGAQGEILVCAAADARCFDGVCGPGCGTDMLFGGGCSQGNGNTCSSTTGLCECSAGTECDSGVCGADHHCGCDNDDDCTAAGLDKCLDGVCGCGSATSCTAGFVSATPVCE